jgi:hypothetical protein
VTFLP